MINSDFFAADEESVDLSSQLETSISVGEHAFSQMQGDLDQQRLLGERPLNDPLSDIMVKEIQHQERSVFFFGYRTSVISDWMRK